MTPINVNDTLILEPGSNEPQRPSGEESHLPLPERPALAARPEAPPLWGVYPGLVVDPQDKEGQGRMLVELPWAYDPQSGPLRVWARLVGPLAGNGYGAWLPPEAGAEVLVAFAHGDPRNPYIVGSLWNGRDQPPTSASSGERVIRTPGGLALRFDESGSRPSLRLETPDGMQLALSDEGGQILLDTGSGSRIEISPNNINVIATGEINVQASVVKISAGMVTIDSGMVKVSGIVQADTVITNSVVASSYTPGAGNIW
jgi:uncharacterized protein involved in type VI secretion and phage assembly